MDDTYVPYKKREGVCDSFCNGCVFKGYANANLYLCEYFLQTGVQRPCPAGTGCTVKATGKRKIRWKHEHDRTWKNRKKIEKAKEKPKAEKPPKPVYHKVCRLETCGMEFDTTNIRQLYCCKLCASRAKNRAFYERQKEDRSGGGSLRRNEA